MEQWKQLEEAGLLPPGLGLPPQALRGVPLEGRSCLTLPCLTDTGKAREHLLWIWEQLGNLRRLDVQLLGQLCSLALQMGVLREELAAILEEEDPSSEEEEEQVEEEALPRKQEEDLGPSWLATRLPDFEMTI
ncbi:glutamate-rich protein 4 [Echinops telfairi]|uniref:Glutamate-rich protein 4 n=1 Tax=Echinops telfairi TaxID=9371 RepID=A0ABM0IY05_ECHTE|nr:glutamate-rich protein 4 [Echinops telfairi]